MRHRPRHPQEIERRFCKPVEPVVEHRLPELLQAQRSAEIELVRA